MRFFGGSDYAMLSQYQIRREALDLLPIWRPMKEF
jgi:hypothetical protein